MNVDPQLIDFIRKHAPLQGEHELRRQLLEDGVDPEELTAAFEEAAVPIRKQRRWPYAALLISVLLLVASYIRSGRNPEAESGPRPTPADPYQDSGAPDDRVFRGHYGYLLKLPPGYEAIGSFSDSLKIQEVVHIFPKNTDFTHLINEGLYGSLGILRLEISPRRVPQGVVDIPVLAKWVAAKLAREKSKYQKRDQAVHGMEGFVITVSEPFPSVRAYVVGQKAYYTLIGGSENTLFTGVLSSIIEANPHDNPGK